jgi:hypothetical protein
MSIKFVRHGEKKSNQENAGIRRAPLFTEATQRKLGATSAGRGALPGM